MSDRAEGGRFPKWALGLLPIVFLAVLILVFLRYDPTAPFRAAFPPVEELTIERVTFPDEGTLRIHVVNGGPQAVTIAQVMVDEAYWQYRIDGDNTLPRLRRTTLEVDYEWVEGEPHIVKILTSTGLTFQYEVAVATESPRPNAQYLTTFALLGIYAGLIPVLLGLLWYPFLKRIDRKWLHFYLSLTIGLLVFLVVDAFEHTLEAAAAVPSGFQGVGLITLGVVGAIVGLRAISGLGRGGEGNPPPGITVAYLIALGIGLHNLGEGLAIGAAYSLGEIALGSFLVIGFALHNTTEGLAIVAPMAEEKPALWHFGVMGIIAGMPTVIGAWVGGFAYAPAAATFFLALGAGAIIQVIIEVGKLVQRTWPRGLFTPLNAVGLILGVLIMYGTALMVVA
jgi:zinc transporter ZupT